MHVAASRLIIPRQQEQQPTDCNFDSDMKSVLLFVFHLVAMPFPTLPYSKVFRWLPPIWGKQLFKSPLICLFVSDLERVWRASSSC